MADAVLAMKCLAMRIGEEYHDIEDVRFLLRLLNITSYEEVEEIILQYYSAKQIPVKTVYILKELLTR